VREGIAAMIRKSLPTLFVLLFTLLFRSSGAPLVVSAGDLSTPIPGSSDCSTLGQQLFDVVRISQDHKYILADWSKFNKISLEYSEVRLIDIEAGKLLFVINAPTVERFSGLDISPNNDYFLIGPINNASSSKVTTMWSLSTGKKVRTINSKDHV
jgi:hypothetical protein